MWAAGSSQKEVCQAENLFIGNVWNDTDQDSLWQQMRESEGERVREREREMHMGMFHIMNADKNTDY